MADDIENKPISEGELNSHFSRSAPEPVAPQAAPEAPTPIPATGGGEGAKPTAADLRSIASGLGYKTDGFADDRQFGLSLIQQLNESKSYADVGRKFAPHREHIEKFLAEQAKSQDQQNIVPAEDRFAKHWGAPKWNDQWDQAIDKGLVVQNEQGMFVAAPGYEAHVAGMLAPLNEARAKQSAEIRRFFGGNPIQTTYEALLPILREEWRKDAEEQAKNALNGYQQEQTQVSTLHGFEAKYEAELYAGGSLTEKGAAFVAAVKELEEHGMKDLGKRLEVAAKIAGLTGQSPEPVAPAAPPAPKKPFIEQVRQRAQHNPTANPQPAATPALTEGELQSYFSSRAPAGIN